MRTFLIITVLFSGSAIVCFSQSIEEERILLIETLINPKGSNATLKNKIPLNYGGRVKAETSTTHRLAGYIGEVSAGESSFHKSSEVRLSYHLPSAMTYTYFNETDTSKFSQYEMDPDFDYNFKDMFNMLDPGVILLRKESQGGNINGHFLKRDTKQKINGQWRPSSRILGRTQVPYGFEYAELYSFNESCPDAWEFESKGEWKDGLWIRTMDVTKHDCHTVSVVEAWREVWKFDEKGRKREDANYYKNGDQYTLSNIHTYDYDNNDRLIEQMENVTGSTKLKYLMSYDERSNELLTGYKWDGSNWQLYTKTVAERTIDGSYQYTNPYLVNGVWKVPDNGYRYLYKYDVRNRLINSLVERWDQAVQKWKMAGSLERKYFIDDLVAEEESIDDDGNGNKYVYKYDNNNRLINIQSWQCENLSDCVNKIYTPLFKGHYENNNGSQLDYFTFQRYDKISTRWVRFDSVANKYSKDNEILESFWQSYEGNYPEKRSFGRHYTFSYDDFIVTGLPEEDRSQKLYPNPASNIIYFDVVKEKMSSLTVTNMLGKEVNIKLQNSLKGNDHCEADISNLNPGIYVVRYFVNNGFVTEKLLKE